MGKLFHAVYRTANLRNKMCEEPFWDLRKVDCAPSAQILKKSA